MWRKSCYKQRCRVHPSKIKISWYFRGTKHCKYQFLLELLAHDREMRFSCMNEASMFCKCMLYDRQLAATLTDLHVLEQQVRTLKTRWLHHKNIYSSSWQSFALLCSIPCSPPETHESSLRLTSSLVQPRILIESANPYHLLHNNMGYSSLGTTYASAHVSHQQWELATRTMTPIKGSALISSIVAVRPVQAWNSCSQSLLSALTVVGSIVV